VARKKRHHYIPQFYLRGFASQEPTDRRKPRLWVRDAHSGLVAQRTPEQIAVEIGYYAIETDQGIDFDTLENELAKMEDQAACALREMLGRPVGNRGSIPIEVEIFVAWLGCRIPWLRRIVVESWPKHVEDMAWGKVDVADDPDFTVLIKDLTSSEAQRLPLNAALDAIRSGRWVAQLEQNQIIDMMRFQHWYFGRHRFPNLFWTILTAPTGDHFITSDRPVVWYVPERGWADSLAALKHPDVELTVPLDARTALLATAAPPPEGTKIKVSDINYRTWCFAERFVASRERSVLEEIAQLRCLS
jgi:hypothetical protein